MARESNTSDPAFLAAYGDAVVARREELGMDRKDLAAETGISYSYLSAIESGQKMPSGSYQTMLAMGLGLSPADLLARANGAVRHQDVIRDMTVLRATVEPPPEEERVAASPMLRADRGPESRAAFDRESYRSSSGIAAELEALLPQLTPEDQDMVLGMVRRLAGSEPPPRRRSEIRQQGYRGRRGRASRPEAYLRFWTMYIDELRNRGLDWGQGRTPEPRSYFTTPSPIRGSSLSASFARNKRLRYEMYINRGSREANVELLKDLEAHRTVIEQAYGGRLDFEDPGRERRAVRIAEYRAGHIHEPHEFEQYVEWFVDRGIRMRRALEAYVQEAGPS